MTATAFATPNFNGGTLLEQTVGVECQKHNFSKERCNAQTVVDGCNKYKIPLSNCTLKAVLNKIEDEKRTYLTPEFRAKIKSGEVSCDCKVYPCYSGNCDGTTDSVHAPACVHCS